MPLEEEGREKVAALRTELEKLSGKFGELEKRLDGTLVSNDEGYKAIKTRLKESLSSKHGGLGIFIGSGGVLSLLPDLPIHAAVVVDKNLAIQEYNQMLQTLIIESDTPGEVWDKLNNRHLEERFQIIKDLRNKEYAEEINLSLLNKEAREYGDDHWINPDRFAQVKSILRKKPIIYVSADVTNEGFGRALRETAKEFDIDITFANFSNLHSWLKPKTMDFIKDWPFSNDATIIFSSHSGALLGDFPKMQLAGSREDYVSKTKED